MKIKIWILFGWNILNKLAWIEQLIKQMYSYSLRLIILYQAPLLQNNNQRMKNLGWINLGVGGTKIILLLMVLLSQTKLILVFL